MITFCRSCQSDDLHEIVDLGDQYLSDFRDDDTKPPRFPLALVLCETCLLVQLGETVPRELMYTANYGFYSGVNEGIRKDLESVVHQALAWVPDAKRWLDIACNDGTLLSFVPKRINRLGIDPVEKFAETSVHQADRIVSDFFRPEHIDEPLDVITSVSMFYDLDDPTAFVEDVKSVLAPDGVWVIQQNYLLAMLQSNSVDNICHEHITYWSLKAFDGLLRDCGLRILDVRVSDVNGGSIRTVVCHEQSRLATQHSVARQMRREHGYRLSDPATYTSFAQRALIQIHQLSALVQRIHATGQDTFIYAASTRGATIWQAAGITDALCSFAVERNPDKVGKMYSAVGCPIISEEEARLLAPSHMLVGPWWFRPQVIEREDRYLTNGGRLIFPLPRVEVVSKATRRSPVQVHRVG